MHFNLDIKMRFSGSMLSGINWLSGLAVIVLLSDLHSDIKIGKT